MIFPNNPIDGMVYSPASGVIYIYNASTTSWDRVIVNNVPVQQATAEDSGVMSIDDYKKLNRILLPPPSTSLSSPNCATPFEKGIIALHGGDDFVKITGEVDVINGSEVITLPFHVHQHTFAFDFSLNLDELFKELDRRGQLNIKGKKGPTGEKGDKGDRGPDVSLTGPKGLKGVKGQSLECEVAIEPEIITNNPRINYKRAIVDARVVVNDADPSQYKLVLYRKELASTNDTATLFDFNDSNSPWMLATQGSIGKQQLYYFDASNIINTIRDKFESEAARLKVGYENVVKLWVQTMSDLFDQQKAALCCSLEFCKSKISGIQVRQHMETTSAIVTGRANAILHNKRDPEAALVSGSLIRKTLGQRDVCSDGTNNRFPTFPDPEDGVVIPPPPPAPPPPAPPPPAPPPPAPPPPAPPPPAPPQAVLDAGWDVPVIMKAQPQETSYSLLVDAISNINSADYGSKIELQEGEYVATIDSCCPQFGEKFTANNLFIQHNSKSGVKQASFVDKGEFDQYAHAAAVYNGQAISFNHSGGEVSAFFKIGAETQTSDFLKVIITKSGPLNNGGLSIKQSKIAELQNALDMRKCDSFCVNLSGQQYIVVRSPIYDSSLAVVLPTFDCANILQLGDIGLFADNNLKSAVLAKLASGDITNTIGKHATINNMLFPSI